MSKQNVERVGGWLILLVAVIGLYFPFILLNSVRLLMSAEPIPQAATAENWQLFRALLVCFLAARAGVCFFVAWRLAYRKSPSTPRVAIIGIWIGLVLLNGVVMVIGGIFSTIPYPVGAALYQMFWPLVISVMATAYLLRSRRVADTYGTRRRSELETVFE